MSSRGLPKRSPHKGLAGCSCRGPLSQPASPSTFPHRHSARASSLESPPSMPPPRDCGEEPQNTKNTEPSQLTKTHRPNRITVSMLERFLHVHNSQHMKSSKCLWTDEWIKEIGTLPTRQPLKKNHLKGKCRRHYVN